MELKTYWAKEQPPYGAFDDYVIIESNNERLLMRPEEFDYLANKLFDNWKLGISNYIQILKEWNECIGYNNSNEDKSEIKDMEDTIKAIGQIKGEENLVYGKLNQSDLQLIFSFFNKNKTQKTFIYRE